MKLGSLFDGSGGFPLSGYLVGIEPVWAAEVEPYPIAVTKSRFPNMKHLGSVTDVRGDKIEPVDIICFGSPCQSLSVAGKREGLKHTGLGDDETTRSGLFVEAVRIIKEMREATNGVYPRFAVWENVPGAFSSNRGEDFRIVLEKLIQVAEPTAVMPSVPKAGWAYADSYRGDGWSIAYRTFDAQYWGVPQRRRRIYLVADFRGGCAGEILFKRQGLRGYFETGKTPWQGITQDAERGTVADDSEIPYTLIVHSGVERDSKGKVAGKGALIQKNKSATLSTVQDQYLFQPVTSVENHPADSRVNLDESGKVQILTSRMGTGGGNVPMVMEKIYALDRESYNCGQNFARTPGIADDGVAPTIIARGPGAVCYCLQDKSIGRKEANSCHGLGVSEETAYTLTGIDRHAVAHHGAVAAFQTYQKVTGPLMANSHPGSYTGQDAFSDMLVAGKEVVPSHYIVRRLMPTECARLQGFPDNWGHPDHKDTFTKEEYEFWLDVRNTHAIINGKATKNYTKDQMLSWYNKLHTDGAEYKMWGNGIALPNALYVMQGIAEVGNA